MLQHIREIHDKTTKLTCKQCSRVFFRKSNLTRHLKSCKGKQPKSSTGRVLKRKQSSSKTLNKKMKLDKPKLTMFSMQSITKVYIEETTGRTRNSNAVIGIYSFNILLL